jgi:hypothetical protein
VNKRVGKGSDSQIYELVVPGSNHGQVGTFSAEKGRFLLTLQMGPSIYRPGYSLYMLNHTAKR